MKIDQEFTDIDDAIRYIFELKKDIEALENIGMDFSLKAKKLERENNELKARNAYLEDKKPTILITSEKAYIGDENLKTPNLITEFTVLDFFKKQNKALWEENKKMRECLKKLVFESSYIKRTSIRDKCLKELEAGENERNKRV